MKFCGLTKDYIVNSRIIFSRFLDIFFNSVFAYEETFQFSPLNYYYSHNKYYSFLETTDSFRMNCDNDSIHHDQQSYRSSGRKNPRLFFPPIFSSYYRKYIGQTLQSTNSRPLVLLLMWYQRKIIICDTHNHHCHLY
jgi:hypothetical protein